MLLLLINVICIGDYVNRTGTAVHFSVLLFHVENSPLRFVTLGSSRARFEASTRTVGWAMIYHAGGWAMFDLRRFAFWIPCAPSALRVVDDAFLSIKERDHYRGARHK
jgi:hypothetical protein